ncbi:MAG: hypothetical protein IE931_05575 [Sphingobacteriales bacterium]|nr:hypothetical protein [Sphingobacteriales bacterium]
MAVSNQQIKDWQFFCEQVQSTSTVDPYEEKSKQENRKAKALKDFNYFVRTYLSVYSDCDCADFHVDAANKIVLGKRDPENPNLIAVLEWPREHAKSVIANIAIPMWMLAKEKLNGMILMGKNEDDARVLLGDLQAQLQFNDLFIHDFGDHYNKGDWQDGDFTTKKGIRFAAYGRDQSPRGARKGEKRPNYAVCDDIDDDQIVNNQKRVRNVVERILGALFFALETKKGGTLVIAGNRIHAQSILAHMVGDIKPGAPKREGIYHSKVFAIDPKTGKPAWHQRYTYGQIMNKVKAAGNAIGRREFFHENHREGTIFKDKYFHWIPMRDWRKYQIIIGYYDPSFENNPTSDFKAVRIWGGYETPSGEWQRHCLKSFVRQTDTIDVFEWMASVEDSLPASVSVLWYMEKQFFNRQLTDALKIINRKREAQKKRKLVVLFDNRVKGNKYVRIVKMEPSFVNGENFFNLDQMHNPDMVEGNNQLKGIEPGYNSPDDSPDADESAHFILDQHKPSANFKPIIKQHKKLYW